MVMHVYPVTLEWGLQYPMFYDKNQRIIPSYLRLILNRENFL